MRGIDGRVALVTGGAQGIGLATVERLVEEGANVVIADIADDAGREAAHALDPTGDRVAFIHADVSDEEAVRAVATATTERFKAVDFLVTCAATFIMKGVDATVEEWRRTLDVNVIGPALCVKHVAPYMKHSSRGSIVHVASISGHVAQPGYLTYNTSKAAVVNMTRCMALDLAPLGIRVNAVNPGTVWNKNNERYHREELSLTREQAERHPDIGGKHVLHRVADPEEIASAIVFLLSEEASFVTGENLMVDGGYTAL